MGYRSFGTPALGISLFSWILSVLFLVSWILYRKTNATLPAFNRSMNY
ncbi:hypothetical protein LINGRAHAP2_LOCUS18801 [Linum grandiflorum]